MGPRTNVAAGTITCNFDGVAKNRTVIGSDCFVGSNTTLVAPVTLGDGCLTAAGSVVTQVRACLPATLQPGDGSGEGCLCCYCCLLASLTPVNLDVTLVGSAHASCGRQTGEGGLCMAEPQLLVVQLCCVAAILPSQPAM